MIRIPSFAALPWLRHGFSTRHPGASTMYDPEHPVLNLGFTADDDAEHVRENRERLLRAVAGAEAATLVTVRQVHGTAIDVITAAGPRRGSAPEADGMITATAGMMLGVQAADCVPILIADQRLRVVAGVHAGWRGTSAGIVARAVEQMRALFASQPPDLRAAIGPAIGACCYGVGEEVRARFAENFSGTEAYFARVGGELRLDLAEANRRQLLASGLSAAAVSVVGECTACTRENGLRKYFSHRAERGFTGRGMGVIGIVPAP